jgi:hypothetical protein
MDVDADGEDEEAEVSGLEAGPILPVGILFIFFLLLGLIDLTWEHSVRLGGSLTRTRTRTNMRTNLKNR